jgi:tRNA(Ile)-lysidine synthetase-like protein
MTTPDPRRLFLEQVRAAIDAYDLLPRATRWREPGRPVVVGVSGGPDSVALLLALHELSTHGEGPTRTAHLAIAPAVAHLNHGLRPGAADEDQAFVENLARKLRLPCEVGRADVRAEAELLGVGIEEAARHARRSFLAGAARRRGARWVALAHHADDRAETVLFHILRGTGVEGLAALGPRAPLLPEEGIEIVRPLIGVPRRLILGYLDSRGQAYREDETNQTNAHTRNRLRHELLPLLKKEFNPQVDDALLRLADQAAAAGDVLADALDAVWRQIVREVPAPEGKKVSGTFPPEKVPDTVSQDVRAGSPDPPRADAPSPERRVGALHPPSGSADAVPSSRACGAPPPQAILIDADDFAPLRPWMQGAILRRAVARLGGGLKYMSMERTREAVAALLSKTIAGPIDLPGSLVAERRRRTIRISKGSAERGVRSVE